LVYKIDPALDLAVTTGSNLSYFKMMELIELNGSIYFWISVSKWPGLPKLGWKKCRYLYINVSIELGPKIAATNQNLA